MALPADASVLVVLVASDGAASWLPEVLAGIAAQQHRPLDIIAVDNATSDGCSALLTAELGDRRIIRSDVRVPYAQAAVRAVTAALGRGFQADAYLFLHDDCALDPGALDQMLGILGVADPGTDPIGIVAPRLVDWDAPDVLQDVGHTTDRFGRAVPRVERGELDQGQHTGVRAVLYASSAAMLIDGALLQRIGLFDERYSALREDLDLCWRARLAGALTVVAADARARHIGAMIRNRRPGPARGRIRELSDRNLIATILKNEGRRRLLLSLPMTIAISLANAFLFLASGRRELAAQVMRAVGWNITHLRGTLRERGRIQRLRTVSDREIAKLQHHGGRRLRAQLERVLERIIGEVRAPDDADLDAPPRKIFERLREHPIAATVLVAFVLGVFATRSLWSSGPISGADHGPFPASAWSFFQEFGSGWRGPSGSGPASPALLLFGGLSTLTFGIPGLAHRLLLAGLVPIAGIGAAFAARRIGLGRTGRIAAAFAYGLSPLMLGAFSDGRLIELTVLAAAPWIIPHLVIERSSQIRAGRGRALLVLIVAAAIAPWTLILIVGAGVVLAITRRGVGPMRVTGLLVGGSLAALLPWSVELFRHGSAFFAGGDGAPAALPDLWTGLARGVVTVPLAYGIAAAAAVGVAIARDDQRRMTLDLVALGLAGIAWAGAVGRLPVLAERPALPLTLGAYAGALLVAIAADRIVPLLRGRTFGAVHVATGVAGILLAAQAGMTAQVLVTSPTRELRVNAYLSPGFLAYEEEQGAFSILWLDGSAHAPRFALTGARGLTILDHLERPAGPGYDAAERAVEILAGDAGTAAGRVLATIGVRYVIVRPTASDDLVVAVGDQIELTFQQEVAGARIFHDALDLYEGTSMLSPAWATVSSQDLDAAQGVESNPFTGSPLRRSGTANYSGVAAKDARALLLGQPFHPKWRAFLAGREVRPRRSFGWATGFDLPKPLAKDQRVRIVWRGHLPHRLGLLAWVLILVLLSAAWTRGGGPEEDL